MTATELEDRLRSGLRAAAEALPPAPAAVPAPADETAVPPHRPHRLRTSALARAPRRWARPAVAAAVTLAAVAGTAVILTRDGTGDGDGDRDRTEVAGEPSTSSTTTAPPHQVRMLNGMVPGQATADRDGTALRTFGPDGQPTGSVELGMTNVQAAASDLDGGWVVCGLMENPEAGQPVDPEELAREAEAQGDPSGGATAPTTVPANGGEAGTTPPTIEASEIVEAPVLERLAWYPADGPPVPLTIDGGTPMCSENSVQVVDSADGPMALIGGFSFGGETPSVRLDGIVLATGEHREIPVPNLPGLPGRWSATTGRAIANIDGIGLRLYDLERGEELPIAAIDPGPISHMALAHDGKTVAVLKGEIEGPDEAIVYDLATGAEIYRRSFDMSIEGDELSYDGKTLAVGSYYTADGPITVIDLATGAEHTIAAGGVIL